MKCDILKILISEGRVPMNKKVGISDTLKNNNKKTSTCMKTVLLGRHTALHGEILLIKMKPTDASKLIVCSAL